MGVLFNETQLGSVCGPACIGSPSCPVQPMQVAVIAGYLPIGHSVESIRGSEGLREHLEEGEHTVHNNSAALENGLSIVSKHLHAHTNACACMSPHTNTHTHTHTHTNT